MGRLAAALLGAIVLLADADDTVVLFYGEGCPHCATEREFLGDLVAAHPDITVVEHDVWHSEAGRRLFVETMEARGLDPEAVPTTIVGDRVLVGFSDEISAEIAAAVGVGTATPTDVVDVPLVGPIDVGATSLVAATVAIALVDGVNPCSL